MCLSTKAEKFPESVADRLGVRETQKLLEKIKNHVPNRKRKKDAYGLRVKMRFFSFKYHLSTIFAFCYFSMPIINEGAFQIRVTTFSGTQMNLYVRYYYRCLEIKYLVASMLLLSQNIILL